MNKPSLAHQGKIVVEPDDGAFLAMFPDGRVERFATKAAVERAAKQFFKRDLGKQAIGLGLIEWRMP